jgi:polyhydroxyalkanoic acid synthase PhaR subunit
VTEQRGALAGMDPAELWRQWYENATKMWSGVWPGAMRGGEGYMDPFGLYRQWMGGLQEMQRRMSGTAVSGPANGNATDVQSMWQRWYEISGDAAQKGAEFGQNAMEIYPRWVQMLEEARDNLLAVGTPPTDPLQFATIWYNATSGPFSDFVGDVIEREEFLEPSSRFLQNYASFYKVFKRNSEEYFKNLQLPVRSDITRVAGLVVNLEDKIDRIEEVLEDFEYGYAEPATAESVQGLEDRLKRVERKLDAYAAVSALEGRLDRVEGKLDRLLAAIENGATNGGSQAASQSSEAPSVREVAETNGSPAGVRATDAARRKAREMGVDLATVQGTGTDGQITVADVRKKGES